MIWRPLYSALMHVARALVWLAWHWRARTEPAWGERWGERRGRVAPPAGAAGGIVVHAVSMGETMAALPLVETLLRDARCAPVTLTCTTPTASALIRQRFGDRVHHVYLPFDTPGATRRFMAAWRPRALVLMETELWPNLLRAAADDAVPVVLANARLSERSAQGYARWRWLLEDLLEPVDLVLAQTEDERRRFVGLGLAPGRTAAAGNLKADLPRLPPEQVEALRAAAPGRRVFLAASTHAGEEEALLGAWARMLQAVPEAARSAAGTGGPPLLVMAPRHPQRFDEVAALVDASGLGLVRRSQERAPTDAQQVLLVDRMGEVPTWCAVAELVFVGGSLIERGGHNPLEPAAQRRAVVTGPHVFNFQSAFDRLDAAGATVRVRGEIDIAELLVRWRDDPRPYLAMGEQAHAVAAEAGGALARTMARLGPLLERLPARHALAWPGERACHDPALLPGLQPHHFDPAWWQAQGAASGHDSGRARVWFVRTAGGELLLRHYWRGGLVARIVRDRFAPEPAARSRALAEFRVLRRMRAWGLPVPRPAAARWQRAWPGYRADILVERIPAATDLARWLAQAPVPAPAWQRVGEAIGRLHRHGVCHADLNAHNLLLDGSGAAWVVDFDRARVRPPGAWMDANLARLERSLEKLQREAGERQAAFHWKPATDWPAMVAGWRIGLEADRGA